VGVDEDEDAFADVLATLDRSACQLTAGHFSSLVLVPVVVVLDEARLIVLTTAG
jgi:hypothetical protein